MELNEKDLRKIGAIVLVLVLAGLVFYLLRPVLQSIIGGLILAYIFLPIHKKINKKITEKNTSAAITTVIALLLIIIPLWFVIPLLAQQSFQVITSFQGFNVGEFVQQLFPTASEQFIIQTTVSFNNFISKAASGTLNYIVSFLLDLPTFILQLFMIGFVFFFTLRDADKIKHFASEASPINKKQGHAFVKKFKDITDSIIYGQIVVGLFQGIVAGVGFLIFGVPNPIVLTVVAVIFSVMPIVGPALLWIPVFIYLLFSSPITVAILFLLYNGIIVSSVDNILRSYIVARRSDISTAVVFIGMIGGVIIFGVLGLILGPLILAYFLMLIESHREGTLANLFTKEKA